mmetsp:Transcript_43060/g.71584  ORF Transcript_43060/g.71584 Transcript_43060/m.71584 type:complete len:225 (-) Transcript_43060:173-847(-)
MFSLARLQDTVHIKPDEFAKPGENQAQVLLNTITEAINEKYPNRVIPNVGLCVALHDILHIGEAFLYQGSAAQHTSVEFRLVMFRPFVGQILTGKVASCDPEGVRLTMGFFDDIHVPQTLLQKPSVWSTEEKVWVWELYADNPLYLDLENLARFRVLQITYRNQQSSSSANKEQGRIGITQDTSAMQITATIDEPGLGLVTWWPDDMPQEMGEEGDEWEGDNLG